MAFNKLIDMEKFSTRLTLRIDWSEIDLFAHVNNVAIIKYIQAARVNLLDALGLMQKQAEEKKGPILASVECQFFKPMYYPGQVIIHSEISLVKNSSFKIIHTLYNEKEEITAKANDIIVYYDFIENTKLKIDDTLRKKMHSESSS